MKFMTTLFAVTLCIAVGAMHQWDQARQQVKALKADLEQADKALCVLAAPYHRMVNRQIHCTPSAGSIRWDTTDTTPAKDQHMRDAIKSLRESEDFNAPEHYISTAAPFQTHFAVLHGAVRPKTQGIQVQLHLAKDVHPTQVRIVNVATNKFIVVPFTTVVRLVDHNAFVAIVPTADWACNLGDVVRLEALIDGVWTPQGGTIKVAGY